MGTKEAAEFKTAEGELVEALDVLQRATNIISREMEKNPALVQQTGAGLMKMMATISSVIDAAGMSATDQQHLAALIQSNENNDDADGALGSPEAAVYKTHSGGITDLLDDMHEKAENELNGLRKAEMSSQHNFEML